MKRFLPALVILGILVAPMVLAAYDATKPPDCCQMKKDVTIGGVTCAKDAYVGPSDFSNCPGTPVGSCLTDSWGMYCLLNSLNSIVDWIFIILVAIAAILVIFGAFSILTSGGSPEKVTSGRNFILYAAIGLLVAFLAKAVPGIVKMVSGF